MRTGSIIAVHKRSPLSFRLILTLLFIAPLAHADIYRILDSDKDGVQARVDSVLNARSEVLTSYFIYHKDITSLAGLALLREAARRGVKVKIILDASFHALNQDMIDHLRLEGIEVKLFHPFNLRHPTWVYKRMHDKLVIVDGKRVIGGGRNIENSYFGYAEKNYLDRDVYIEGEAAKKAHEYYLKLWESHHVDRPPSLRTPPVEVAQSSRLLDEALVELKKVVSFENSKNWAEGEPDVGKVRFLHSTLERGKSYQALTGDSLAELAQSAKKSILIESPYMVPTKRFLKIMKDARARGVHVRIMTNSLHSTDGILPAAGYAKYKQKLLDLGIELWEYQGPESLHAKSAVIDGKIAIIGSYNLDPRSAQLNTEVAFVAENLEKAEQLTRSFNDNLKRAVQYDTKGRPIPSNVRVEIPSLKKRVLEKCIRYALVPLIKRQL